MDELVPEDHLVRKLDACIDFSFIYDLVKDKYSTETGRPSIDPIVLFKIVFTQYISGIHTACDNNTYILEIDVTSANIHDSTMF